MTIRRRNVLAAIALALGAPLLAMPGFGAPAGAEAAATTSAGEVVVMTRNLYLGADVSLALDALPDVSAAAQAMWDQVAQTDFAQRAPALASDVVAARPAVLGLQEATVWECLDASGAPVDVFDFTTQFLDALGADGADYVIASAGGAEAVSPGFAIAPIPGATVVSDPTILPEAVGSASAACGFRLADVLTVRADLAGDVVAVGTTTYAEKVSLVPGVIEIQRGYAWADIRIAGEVVRFVTTHLESTWSAEAEPAAAVQSRQLVSDLSGVSDPLVVMGDFNSDPRDPRAAADANPGGQPEQSATCPGRSCSAYWTMVDAGFTDSGPDATDPANLTWGSNAYLAGPDPARLAEAQAMGNDAGFTDRLDYVFVRNGVEVVDADVVGNRWPDDPAVWDCNGADQVALTRENAEAMGIPVPSGGRCFATDHAGLVVTLAVGDATVPEASTTGDLGAGIWWVIGVGALALIAAGALAVVVIRGGKADAGSA